MNFIMRIIGCAAGSRLGRTVLPWVASHRIRVLGGSMYPLLHPGEIVLCHRLAYCAGQRASRGDIVLFKHPAGPSGRMIKLIAGLPGEQIEVRNDRLWINDRALQFHTPMVGSLPGRWKLTANELFVLSYAVAVGTDSRTFGPIEQEQVLGKVWYLLPPSARKGRLDSVQMSLSDNEKRPQ
ncbi:MAG: signal peptidase I [Chloroflexota bacterium]